jgi:hypothetical protein
MAPSLTTNVDEYPGSIFAATKLSKDTTKLGAFHAYEESVRAGFKSNCNYEPNDEVMNTNIPRTLQCSTKFLGVRLCTLSCSFGIEINLGACCSNHRMSMMDPILTKFVMTVSLSCTVRKKYSEKAGKQPPLQAIWLLGLG